MDNPDRPNAATTPLAWRRALRSAGWIVILMAEGVAVLWLVNELTDGNIVEASRLCQFLLTITMAGMAILALIRRRRMVDVPLHKLESLLRELSDGDAPIEELSEVGGRLAPVSRHIQGLLRQIRRQQGEIDHEVRQRVTNHKTALERTIGSLKQKADRDALTGLLNRRAFDECLASGIERSRAESELSLLLIDLDNFKILNDELGHPAGDEWLRKIGQIMRSTIRENDQAFRWGGDEFAVILEGTGAAAAKALAGRLASLGDSLGKTYKLPKRPGMSVGVANFSELPQKTAAAFLLAADAALYQTKISRERKPQAISNIAPWDEKTKS